jgi:hypothetical protein
LSGEPVLSTATIFPGLTASSGMCLEHLDLTIRMHDFPGMLPERRKWNSKLESFKDLHVLFFLDACSWAYPMYEDPSINRFKDSMNLLDRVLSKAPGSNGDFSITVVLSRVDLLDSTLKTHASQAKECFPEFEEGVADSSWILKTIEELVMKRASSITKLNILRFSVLEALDSDSCSLKNFLDSLLSSI